MEHKIEVSVVCNVFKHEPYLRDTLDGFVMQKTNFPFDVLVHDDASPDGSADIIREYEAKYPDLFKPIYQTENQYSQKRPINVTFQIPRIQSKYVAICEGDDYWTDPEKLQKQYDFMEAHPEYSMCLCSTEWMNLRTGVVEKRGCIDADMDITLEDVLLEKGKGRFFQSAAVFVRTEVFTQRPDWFTKFPIGDYPLAVNAALHGKIRMLADKMTVYRYYSANSWTVRMDNDEARARISLRMIEGLEALDEATGGEHAAMIAQRIRKHEYTYALMTHNLKEIRHGKLKDMYRSRSFLYRLSDVTRCKYPRFYTKVFKPMVKVIKSNYGE